MGAGRRARNFSASCGRCRSRRCYIGLGERRRSVPEGSCSGGGEGEAPSRGRSGHRGAGHWRRGRHGGRRVRSSAREPGLGARPAGPGPRSCAWQWHARAGQRRDRAGPWHRGRVRWRTEPFLDGCRPLLEQCCSACRALDIAVSDGAGRPIDHRARAPLHARHSAVEEADVAVFGPLVPGDSIDTRSAPDRGRVRRASSTPDRLQRRRGEHRDAPDVDNVVVEPRGRDRTIGRRQLRAQLCRRAGSDRSDDGRPLCARRRALLGHHGGTGGADRTVHLPIRVAGRRGTFDTGSRAHRHADGPTDEHADEHADGRGVGNDALLLRRRRRLLLLLLAVVVDGACGRGPDCGDRVQRHRLRPSRRRRDQLPGARGEGHHVRLGHAGRIPVLMSVTSSNARRVPRRDDAPRCRVAGSERRWP